MSNFAPLIGLFKALDETAERLERTWWGVVATDSRFPQIWDANYASVEQTEPHLTLSEVEHVLVPAAKEAGARFSHVVLLHPDSADRLLAEAEARGDRIHIDTVMRHVEPPPVSSGGHDVREVIDLTPGFWDRLGQAFREFDVTDPDVIAQMVRREHEVLTPFGKRWFTVSLDREIVGFGALYVHGDVGYVDNVVTFPPARRRGIAGAIVSRIVEEAEAAGAGSVYLLADQPDPIRLYERFGFREVGRIASTIRAV
jgi:ribosomal protein S18 acetylase RimI-like enzyme